jgi:hypothetical protein
MNPIISAALAEDHRNTLRTQAARARRGSLADVAPSDTAHTARAHRSVARPFVAFQGWLARGYL